MIDSLKSQLPDYAKDIKLNLSSLMQDDTLNDQQKLGCFYVSALASRNADVIAAVEAEIDGQMSDEALNGAKAAAAIMAMNNIYYRFVHLSSNPDYKTMQAKLRMNVLASPGVDKVDFELWSLAVSAINGCGMCIDAHEKQLLGHGVSKEQIQTAVRIASVVHAAACILDGEAASDRAEIQKAA